MSDASRYPPTTSLGGGGGADGGAKGGDGGAKGGDGGAKGGGCGALLPSSVTVCAASDEPCRGVAASSECAAPP